MIVTLFMSPIEVAKKVAEQAKEKRLSLNLSQKSLAEKSGVSLAVLKKFEQTGKVSFESILKLALILDSIAEFSELFKPLPATHFTTLDTLLKQKNRKRGRK